jgi:hypothetical protein
MNRQLNHQREFLEKRKEHGMEARGQQAVTKVSESPKRSLLKQGPWTPKDKAEMAVVLGQLLDIQKSYGKTTGQLENIVAGFCFALAPYTLEAVMRGFAEYMRNKADFPAPADIVKIIDPKPPEWKPDKSYYISLKELHKLHGPYGLDNEEIEYIRRYEEHMKQEAREAR